MPGKNQDRFSLTEGVLYGVPLSRPKDVAAWEQRERMVKAQENLNKGVRGHALEIARQSQTGQISADDARAELVKHISTAIHGFVDEQRQIGDGITRHVAATKEGFRGFIAGQGEIIETIENETREQTSSLLAAERRQTKELLGGVHTLHESLGNQAAVQGEHLEVGRQQVSGLAALFDQNERRDFLLASVQAGIKGIMGSNMEQSRLQASLVSQSRRQVELGEAQLSQHADHLLEARHQTELQIGLLQESRQQTMAAEDHLITSQRTNELVEAMARDLVGRLDITNTSLGMISGQIDQLMSGIAEGLQRACMVYLEGVRELGREVALTLFITGKNIEHLARVTFSGFAAIDERMTETNLLLQEILRTLKAPEETAMNESCRIAVRLVVANNFKGATERLEKTLPDSHDFELVHFLLGYAHYQQGNAVAASHYLGWAKRYAAANGNADIAEYSGTLLAQMALELGEFSLSVEALRSLVNDKSLAPYLRQAHLEFAALNSFSGHKETAIGSVINQMITNPRSLDQILSSLFIGSLTDAGSGQQWQSELGTLISEPIQFNADRPHLPYISLSIFAAAQLQDQSSAIGLFRVAMRIWKAKLRPLTKGHVERETISVSSVHAKILNEHIIPILASEAEFSWLR